MASIAVDYEKVIKTYDSCKTLDHLIGAIKFAGLFEYKWYGDEDWYEFMLNIYDKHNQTVRKIEKLKKYEQIFKSQLN